ncbi:MAG: hypothetical protein Ct9H300mP1_27100 [Planctomycetaceae bacterium]|nr:MAG: hypothetical protein Ct9H300mP1_27100 [Planctomycetaceae bacterium]
MSVRGIGRGLARSSCSTRTTVRTTFLFPLTNISMGKWLTRSGWPRPWTPS